MDLHKRGETVLITAIVNFDLPDSMTQEKAKEMFEASAPRYENLPGVGEADAEARVGGGVYLWKDRESADALYEGGWRETIRERFGNEPRISWFETPVIVDNA